MPCTVTSSSGFLLLLLLLEICVRTTQGYRGSQMCRQRQYTYARHINEGIREIELGKRTIGPTRNDSDDTYMYRNSKVASGLPYRRLNTPRAPDTTLRLASRPFISLSLRRLMRDYPPSPYTRLPPHTRMHFTKIYSLQKAISSPYSRQYATWRHPPTA